MKFKITLAILGATLSGLAFAAEPAAPRPAAESAPARPAAASREELVRFNLRFPGGSPRDLAKAIETASGKPCNLIIPPGDETKIPSLELNDVTLPELFAALREGTTMTKPVSGRGVMKITLCDIQTKSDPVTNRSTWYLRSSDESGASQWPSVCRFYDLTPYLERYTLDDITTVLVTAWDLLGARRPKMTFHKETKLLIVVANEEQQAEVGHLLAQLNLGSMEKPAVNAESAPPRPVRLRVPEPSR